MKIKHLSLKKTKKDIGIGNLKKTRENKNYYTPGLGLVLETMFQPVHDLVPHRLEWSLEISSGTLR